MQHTNSRGGINGNSVEQRLSLQQHMKVIPKTVILVKVPRQFIFDKPLREYIQGWKSQVDGNHETSRCSHPKKHKQNKQKTKKQEKQKQQRRRQVRHVRKRQGRFWELGKTDVLNWLKTGKRVTGVRDHLH